ncbi:proline-rich membrane anchor 1 isoform X3 [Scyliorhinus canicula]|uniref:proline-rich membrane anchor 1 isoform X3 n=1 Tax=Scyliorhinus canicula TaxID=7830 RepID=UPI0018F7A0B0|nr:proline-rich membrane anchor 1 isoform X3 [Scyliorhinus canicula]
MNIITQHGGYLITRRRNLGCVCVLSACCICFTWTGRTGGGGGGRTHPSAFLRGSNVGDLSHGPGGKGAEGRHRDTRSSPPADHCGGIKPKSVQSVAVKKEERKKRAQWTGDMALKDCCGVLSQGEVQKSGGRSALDAATGSCHEICSCRPPLLPPPPPPPPPPRQLATPTVKPTDYPPLKPWWTDMVILIAVGCATLVFLVIAVIICYKAIKRVGQLHQNELHLQ